MRSAARYVVPLMLVLAFVGVVSTDSHARAVGAVVSGTVSGTDQGFLTGASVVIEGGVRRATTTDADGRFTFPEVARGRYRIVVSAEGYLPLDRPLDVGDASVSIDIVLLRLPQVP